MFEPCHKTGPLATARFGTRGSGSRNCAVPERGQALLPGHGLATRIGAPVFCLRFIHILELRCRKPSSSLAGPGTAQTRSGMRCHNSG